MTTGLTAKCPECEGDVSLAAGVEKGEIVPCPECGAELEVVGAGPDPASPRPRRRRGLGRVR